MTDKEAQKPIEPEVSDSELDSEDDFNPDPINYEGSEKVKNMTKKWQEAHKGAGAAFIPMQIGEKFNDADTKGELTTHFKMALAHLRGGPYELAHITVARRGVILFIKDPTKMMPPLLAAAKVKVKGVDGNVEERPILEHTKVCHSSYTVMMFDCVEQHTGKVVDAALFAEVIKGYGALKAPPFHPVVRYGGVDTGVKTTNICMHFEGPPLKDFCDWPMVFCIPAVGDFPGYKASYLLYVNDFNLKGRCPKCRRKYSKTKAEEAASEGGKHACPQEDSTQVARASRKHKKTNTGAKCKPGTPEFERFMASIGKAGEPPTNIA